MATHDYSLANQSGASFRTDLNNALAAIQSNNSNSSSPSTTVAYQWWADTNASIFKIRNSANNAWINLFTLAGGIDVDAASNFAAAVTFSDDVTFDGATAGRDIVFDRSANAFTFADNAKAMFGSSNDLQIYHTGTQSYIQDTGTGNLNLQGSTKVVIGNAALDENMAQFFADGAAELYFDNVLKLNTTSNGVTCQDNLAILDNNKITVGTSDDLEIFHDTVNSYIKTTNTNHNLILEGAHGVDVKHGSENMAKFRPDGGVDLFFDNVKKMELTDVGITSLDTLISQGEIRPGPDNDHSIGRSNRRYITIFAVNGSINTSDKNEKNTIIDSDLGLDFINKLKPKSYKWNKDDGKTHYGLIAQDLEETLRSLGKTIADFGGIIKEDDSPMGLGYSELIAPLIKAVQQLSAKVAVLEAD